MILPRFGLPTAGLKYCITVGTVLFLMSSLFISKTWDREAAERALEKARALREQLASLQGSPREPYLFCIRTYQEVYAYDPHFGGSDDAIYEAGELFQALAEKLAEPDFYTRAARLYRYLLSDYPASPRCPDALLRLGKLCAGPLKDPECAREAHERLKTRYKSSPAGASLAGAPIPAPGKKPQPEADAPARPPARGPMAAVENIRYWSTKDYTRVIIDLDGETSYQKTRIVNPDRVFFDISNARVTSDLFNKKFSVSDEFLQQIRIAQNRAGVVRVVLDFASSTEFSVVELHDPFRIVIDVHGIGGSMASKESPGSLRAPRPGDAVGESSRVAAAASSSVQPGRLPEPRSVSPEGLRPALRQKQDFPEKPTSETIQLEPGSKKSDPAQAVSPLPQEPVSTQRQRESVAAYISSPPLPIIPAAPEPKKSPSPGSDRAAANTPSAREPVRPQPAPAAAVPARAPDIPSAPVVPGSAPRPASPTSMGNRTMTRMLGLKIGRIVIDPGHGGHDTGTIGRGGLREKDLVLGVALELRRLLEDKLGAEVILTRETDVFVPLEERTALANQKKADLFLSIHANSASNKNTSGVETYFLNFARSAADREIAARENAASARSVHELQDLVRKIAQAEKSAESRELAAILQKRLHAGLQPMLPSSKNRGVRSAPFVVLIGANMPSVLAEVAFISNPRDERTLRKEDSVQRVAKALFSGIEGYTKTLGGDVAQSQSDAN